MSDVRGLTLPKLALEVMVAGGHNLLMTGSPGVGKTMLARRAQGLCLPLSDEAALSLTKIESIAQFKSASELVRRVPFRAPHHSVSAAGLLGGGAPVRPGEVTLAHHGLLFLDELPEFSRACIEGLREPLEEREVCIVRAQGAFRFPAKFQLIAAMNPCPCGYYNHPRRQCTCSTQTVLRYQQKISGPFVDRMDLVIPIVENGDLSELPVGESSAQIRQRITESKARQAHRLAKSPFSDNASISAHQGALDAYCPLHESARKLLDHCTSREQLSLRAQHRIQKVAQTLCDLRPEFDKDGRISEQGLALALQLRRPSALPSVN